MQKSLIVFLPIIVVITEKVVFGPHGRFAHPQNFFSEGYQFVVNIVRCCCLPVYMDILAS